MTDRDIKLSGIRIQLDLPKDHTDKADRIQFQNEVIRPILKFQNDLLVRHFHMYSTSKKQDLSTLDDQKKQHWIQKALSNDQVLKSFYIGTIIALFTKDEYTSYSSDVRGYNKRIITMLTERIIDQLVIDNSISNFY